MRNVPLSLSLTQKTKTKPKKRNPRINPNLLWASDSLSSSFTLADSQHGGRKTEIEQEAGCSACLQLPRTALVCMCPSSCRRLYKWCALCLLFQVAVTGAPPGQDPWGVIEDAHSLGASALLSHVGEKHLWWTAFLQNRYVVFFLFFCYHFDRLY